MAGSSRKPPSTPPSSVRVGMLEIRFDNERKVVHVIQEELDTPPEIFSYITITTALEAETLARVLSDGFAGVWWRAHAAAELGRRGGKKGGKARAKSLTPRQRSDIARAAAMKRWHGT